MTTYYETLKEKRAELRPARYPNPIERTPEGVWVLVMNKHGKERTRFMVDAADYEKYVAPYRWHVGSTSYNRVCTYAKVPTGSGSSTVLLARWLMNPPADAEVDHVDENPLNNRRENLRIVTRKQNEENKTRKRPGSSKYRGVYLDKQTGRWRAEVTHNYKAHKSPRFDTEEEAAAWASDKRDELFTHHGGGDD